MTNKLKLIENQISTIIEEKQIYAVYQPIVSLKTGYLFGFEALSRIALPNILFTIEEMFSYAEQFHFLWKLEYICRKEALRGIQLGVDFGQGYYIGKPEKKPCNISSSAQKIIKSQSTPVD